jgi:hypothetical protein
MCLGMYARMVTHLGSNNETRNIPEFFPPILVSPLFVFVNLVPEAYILEYFQIIFGHVNYLLLHHRVMSI